MIAVPSPPRFGGEGGRRPVEGGLRNCWQWNTSEFVCDSGSESRHSHSRWREPPEDDTHISQGPEGRHNSVRNSRFWCVGPPGLLVTRTFCPGSHDPGRGCASPPGLKKPSRRRSALSTTSRRDHRQRFNVTDSSGVVKTGSQIFFLQICVIGKDLSMRHPGCQQFQNHRHRISKPSYTRRAVANLWINHDSRVFSHFRFPAFVCFPLFF